MCRLSRCSLTTKVRTHYLISQRVVPGVSGNIDFGRRRFQRRKKISQRKRRIAILPNHRGGNALSNFGQRIASRQNKLVRVAVGVDKTGGQGKAVGINDCVTGHRRHLADGNNAITIDAHTS